MDGPCQTNDRVLIGTGQHNHCDCHSQNHRSISQLARRRMVWECILVNDGILPTPLRQILYVLLHQMGLPHCYWNIRARKFNMRCCAKLNCAHHRTCCCWNWLCRNLLWSAHYCGILGTFGEETHVLRLHWSHVRYCFSRRTTPWWCLH